MKDMFGQDIKPSSRRGDHNFLSGYFDDGKKVHKVKKVGDQYVERQIHDTGIIYAVYTEEKWNNRQKQSLSLGFSPTEIDVYED